MCDARNEQDLWQELFITPGDWARISWTHQVRLEQRWVGGVDGIVPRLRYLLHGARPYQRERSTKDRSDHVLRLQFMFDTKGRHPSHGGT